MKNTMGVQSVFIMCDVVLIIILSLLFYLTRPVATTSVVYIPKGSIGQIIAYLGERKFNVSPLVDKYLLALMGYPQSGWIDMGGTILHRGDFLYKITTAKAAMTEVTLIPGETTDVFLDQLAERYDLSKTKLEASYRQYTAYPEGLLFPETYKVPMGIGERHLMHYLVSLSQKAHHDLAQKIFGEFNERKWYRYLVIASIIQKEAANVEEMPLVSSVIYNRLKRGMKLQMDGTLNYGKYSHVKVTAKRIKEETSRYNTYMYGGLPPTPVATVSSEAIRAAIFPKETTYLYFMKNKKGTHVFSKSYEEHLKVIRSMQH